ncbi:uncharacterized protein Z519_01651 [Cladophialophora bantiana CBS 173.52]|uniref:Extracellular membrane protein CFEM domain-containing protein n=1 Tax=Cladophialophora bantiana (strain ATCC 10958 / CBS 173.52 / CDC B-1940 / NIH 8579) TaxID=1442370 RepID=A0A0D2GI85_CLAB1|nr:uncharacterized protein Z519_01651 [Cladophialophora bantiana CBS 173.52]KIW98067.1 hypothetical protein Z519_01651 [Cladophialophora bantiana CBS 173.52]
MEVRIQHPLILVIIFYALAQSSSATVSFPSIQAIIGFSTSCTLAYDTPVNDCDINDFRGLGGTGSCSTDCQLSLEASQRFVQRFCSGEQADGNSLIGQLFVGNVVNFLCGDDTATSATMATTTQGTTQASSAAESSMSMATDTVPPKTSTTDTSSLASTLTTSPSQTGSASKTTSISTNSKQSSSTPTSIPTSIESATSVVTSISSSQSSSTSSAASSSKTSNTQGSGGGSGGGSPFDGAFSSAASSRALQLQIAILVFAGSSLVVLAMW